MPLVAKLETCDGETLLPSSPKGEEESLKLGVQILADGFMSTSS